MNPTTLRAWRAARQGLDGSWTGFPAAEALARGGWIRSVGGVSPYLALFARCGARRAEVDAATAALALHELPAARGCTYVVPAADFATALRAGQGFGDEAQVNTAKKHLGVTHDELATLEAAVLSALADGPRDPAALKDALGDRVRNLGPDGKKRGVTTTLPLALGRLQTSGQVRRVPVNGRLDQQRYAYTAWTPSPLEGDTRATADVQRDLVAAYVRWAGLATTDEINTFTGFGAKVTKAAVAALGFVAGPDGRWMTPDDLASLQTFAAPTEPCVRLIGALDSLQLLRRELDSLVDPADRPALDALVTQGAAGDALQDLGHHAIVDRGRLIGLWLYDPEAADIVYTTFGTPDDAVRAEVARTAAYVRDDLGDARIFSLDSPASRRARIEALRAR